MVSRAQLDRLSSRIEALAPRAGYRFAVILVRAGETEEAATERHYAQRPEDGDASHVMVVTFVSPQKERAAE